jgi:type II secretory pathway pseudopilin PulG
MKSCNFHGQQKFGFTLFELLIAVGILAFLILVLTQILSATQAIWRDSEARTDPFRDARAAIELISRELSISVVDEKAPVLAFGNIYSQPSDPDGPTHNQQVYALLPMKNVTGSNPSVNNSDICAIGFYCSWDAVKRAYVLRRHYFASDETFSRLQAAGLPTTAAAVAPNSIFAPANPAVAPAQDEDLAAYVWDFKAVPYDYTAGTLTANATYPITYTSVLPQFVEISFKAISPQFTRQLTAQNIGTTVWFDPTNQIYVNQILPHVREFKSRIKMNGAVRP